MCRCCKNTLYNPWMCCHHLITLQRPSCLAIGAKTLSGTSVCAAEGCVEKQLGQGHSKGRRGQQQQQQQHSHHQQARPAGDDLDHIKAWRREGSPSRWEPSWDRTGAGDLVHA